mgnify:FL=1
MYHSLRTMEFFSSDTLSQDFWSEFLNQTERFKRPVLFKNKLQPGIDYDSIFQTFFQRYSADSNFRKQVKIRVYVQNGLTEAALQEIQNQPPEESQSIEEWGEKLFEGKTWCIVLDKVSGVIEDLTVPIAKWLQPLISSFPAGEVKVDVSPYIGRYGFTPFGAHIDVDGIYVMHLQLGPNAKEMTLWEAEKFKQINQSS